MIEININIIINVTFYWDESYLIHIWRGLIALILSYGLPGTAAVLKNIASLWNSHKKIYI
jgi:hypothetical protein